jgi:16S rRNA (adenine1518-N6/adenine1519-N6)-dimethyltransferase
VIGYEVDRELIEWLKQEEKLPENVEIRFQDMLTISLKALARESGVPVVIAGNLPYNISAHVVIKLVEEKDFLGRAVLMFQKEVAERLIAGPGTKKYGILSVLAGQCLSIRRLMDVPPGVFSPRPKVMSSVLEITPRADEIVVSSHDVFRLIVKQAFSKRRKTIRNALAQLFAPRMDLLENVLAQAEIAPGLRAEMISVKKFADLARISQDYLGKFKSNQLTNHHNVH